MALLVASLVLSSGVPQSQLAFAVSKKRAEKQTGCIECLKRAALKKDRQKKNSLRLLRIPDVTTGPFTLRVKNAFLGLEGLKDGQKVYVYPVPDETKLGCVEGTSPESDGAINEKTMRVGNYTDDVITVKMDPNKTGPYEALLFSSQKIDVAKIVADAAAKTKAGKNKKVRVIKGAKKGKTTRHGANAKNAGISKSATRSTARKARNCIITPKQNSVLHM
jgi:hypothetical protein